MNSNSRDPHQSLKNEVLGESRSLNSSFVLAKLQWSKEDIAFSLHAEPHTFSMAGIQATDFLNSLGFERASCSFTGGRQCYVRWVDAGFDVIAFAGLFDQAFGKRGIFYPASGADLVLKK